MPAERLAMGRVREILRYRFEEWPWPQGDLIQGRGCASTVRETLRRAEAVELTYR
ncbi:hypothetical protein SAMN05428953_12123 [Mesorhizobium muleiense]|uniref:Uncharacterized protein n=1 Tax=Mesorhizobium muleiense TaxID=1004279 RepID=A0A1G9EYS3_9HYPH|nr:hypothetical protein SAMN05428953_12123 [Mesorhizobium muleiense]